MMGTSLRTLLFSYLVLAPLCSLSVSADSVHISIDCGSSEASYQDENLITWTGDDKYIKSGESLSVKSVNPNPPVVHVMDPHVMDTMRVFTTRKKNCYHIDSLKRGRVLVRASFYYGNYDNKSSNPIFELQVDGNFWTTVETSWAEYVYYEMIYVMRKDSISVCVAKTNYKWHPFISALEVRTLETFMYASMESNYPLFLKRRVPFAATQPSYRYPDDPYDRIWSGEMGNSRTIEVHSDANFDGLTQRQDIPPPVVLKNAVTALTQYSSLELFTLYNFETPAYVNAYFSETNPHILFNETRAFRVFKNDDSFSLPIIPLYNNFTEICFSKLSVSSKSVFSLVPTTYSTLPPLINALEIFRIGPSLSFGTNGKDVQGLASLQKAFAVLQDWSGDPCLPAPYTWDWIDCDSDLIPRVTALHLSSFNLSGMIPDFSSMDALQTIDLSNNSLQGPIPDFLGTLPNLKVLRLENNNLSGSVPVSLSTKKGLEFRSYGNPGLCTSGSKSCLASAPMTPSASSCSINKIKGNLQKYFATIIPSIVILLLACFLE